MARSETNSFQRWWHAGEEGAVAVFRSSRLPLKMGVSGVIAVIMWRLVLAPYRFGTIAFAIIIVLMAVSAISDSRKAIIFTKTQLIYRPGGIGSWCRVALADIDEIWRAIVTESPPAGGGPILAQRLMLVLKDGQIVKFPLDIAESQSVLQRLKEMTGKQVNQARLRDLFRGVEYQ